jgi:hypothetical protein
LQARESQKMPTLRKVPESLIAEIEEDCLQKRESDAMVSQYNLYDYKTISRAIVRAS